MILKLYGPGSKPGSLDSFMYFNNACSAMLLQQATPHIISWQATQARRSDSTARIWIGRGFATPPVVPRSCAYIWGKAALNQICRGSGLEQEGACSPKYCG